MDPIKIKMAIDRLTDLPDSLLLHIMSFMGMKSVVRTSLISKRWRHLWKSISVMDFDFDHFRPPNIGFIERVIALYEGSKIRKFRVCGKIDDFPRDVFSHERVDSWVSFAVRCNVEELHLKFYLNMYEDMEGPNDDDMYVIPECVFKCKSLVSLKLRRCGINLPGSTYLPGLTSLRLELIELDKGVLKELINGCPSLEDLTLLGCNRFSDLDIHDENGRLKRLKVIEAHSWGTTLQIFAPNLLSLKFVEGTPRKSYEVEDLSSLTVACFSSLVDFVDDFRGRFLQLVDQIRHVKLLVMCSLCITELSIREMRDPGASVTYSSSTLALETGFHKFELMGLAYIMRSFTNLEVLIIDVENTDTSCEYDDYFKDDFDENEVWKSIVTSFNGISKHLKSVKINGLFVETEHVAQSSANDDFDTLNLVARRRMNKESVEKQRYLLAQRRNEEVIEDILKGKANINQFIRVLLTNSAVLQTLTVTTKVNYGVSRCYANCKFIW